MKELQKEPITKKVVVRIFIIRLYQLNRLPERTAGMMALRLVVR